VIKKLLQPLIDRIVAVLTTMLITAISTAAYAVYEKFQQEILVKEYEEGINMLIDSTIPKELANDSVDNKTLFKNMVRNGDSFVITLECK
jgi:Na+-translocating ferredoxin:NAD+ oxidoreductase RnfG subunit